MIRFLKEEDGVRAIEQSLIAARSAAAMIGGMTPVGEKQSFTFMRAANNRRQEWAGGTRPPGPEIAGEELGGMAEYQYNFLVLPSVLSSLRGNLRRAAETAMRME
jgi:Flp pilus assembly pilin Flp